MACESLAASTCAAYFDNKYDFLLLSNEMSPPLQELVNPSESTFSKQIHT
jgi:hypothetical protein